MSGAALTDGNSSGFTARLDPEKTISIGHHRVTVGGTVYRNVEMAELLARLAAGAENRFARPAISPGTLGPAVGGGEDPITADALYPRWASFFRSDDVIM